MKITKFLQVCFGIGFVLFGCAALIYSTQTAQAEESEELSIENARTSTSGNIMMSESGFVYNGVLLYHILVWDSETGKSKLYHYSESAKGMTGAGYQLPSSPLD